MDAAAYLKKQGWRGTGHSLDHTDRGIVKPLQISKKVDALGVGIQKYAAVSDQWWLRAYDQGLKDFGTGKESALATAQKHGVNRGGLYARFVKGQEIPGTIGQRVESDTAKDDSLTNAAIANSTPKQHRISKSSKSKDLKRKRIEEDARPTKKKSRSVAKVTSSSSTSTVLSESEPIPGTQSVKRQIKAYVDEAMKRGLLPADPSTTTSRTKTIPPSDDDMKAVLRLAKMHKTKKQTPQLVERAKLIRNLKRAACKYLESQHSATPP